MKALKELSLLSENSDEEKVVSLMHEASKIILAHSFLKVKAENPECFALLISKKRLIPMLLICAYSYPSIDYFKTLNSEMFIYLKKVGIKLDHSMFAMTSLSKPLSQEQKDSMFNELKPLHSSTKKDYFGGPSERLSYTHSTYKSRKEWIDKDFESFINHHKAGLLHHIILDE